MYGFYCWIIISLSDMHSDSQKSCVRIRIFEYIRIVHTNIRIPISVFVPIPNINEIMAKRHAYSGFNGWHILSSLVHFVDSWYSKVIEIKLMNYFSLASQNSKLERNEAFSSEIILYFIRNKGNYLTFLEFSQFRRRSILQQKEICEAYNFSHNLYDTMHETQK